MIGEFMPGFPSAMLYGAGILNPEALNTETLQITAAIEAAAIAAGLLVIYQEPVMKKIWNLWAISKTELKDMFESYMILETDEM